MSKIINLDAYRHKKPTRKLDRPTPAENIVEEIKNDWFSLIIVYVGLSVLIVTENPENPLLAGIVCAIMFPIVIFTLKWMDCGINEVRRHLANCDCEGPCRYSIDVG